LQGGLGYTFVYLLTAQGLCVFGTQPCTSAHRCVPLETKGFPESDALAMKPKESGSLTAYINARVTADECQLLTKLASEQGLSLSQYVRRVLLSDAQASRDTKLLIGEIAAFADALLSILATALKVDRETLEAIVSASQKKRDVLVSNRLARYR